jgi:hypothetical protein
VLLLLLLLAAAATAQPMDSHWRCWCQGCRQILLRDVLAALLVTLRLLLALAATCCAATPDLDPGSCRLCARHMALLSALSMHCAA